MTLDFFNQQQPEAWWRKALLAITKGLSLWFPAMSFRIGLPILLSPRGRRAVRFDVIQPLEPLTIESKAGQVHVHLFGEGDKVAVLSHGWADTSAKFERLIAALVKQGYQVAAIDQIGHGLSAGKHSHLPAFIESLELVVEHFESRSKEVKALIGHSMGGLAILNLPETLLDNRQVFLISVPINFFNTMFKAVEHAGISRLLVQNILERISSAYDKTWSGLKSEFQQHKMHDKILFIHDVHDHVAPFIDTKDYTKLGKATLFQTEGLGHQRIVSDTSVIELIQARMA